MKICLLTLVVTLAAAGLAAENGVPATAGAFQEGERLLLYNKPEEARLKFEAALREDSRNELVYLHLGIVYSQLRETTRSTEIMQTGLLVAAKVKDLLYFNIGNNFFQQKQLTLAEKNYTLAIEINSLFADAYLNRANTRVGLSDFKNAIEDYTVYLRLKPEAAQRGQIEKMISLLSSNVNEQANLLQSVLSNLQNASTDAQTHSAGTEGFQKPNDEDIDIKE